ncbi:hypothetical protein PHLGIDRAFT_17407, partial [Phlebiopsis gigantea 11061_1 CR5-6]
GAEKDVLRRDRVENVKFGWEGEGEDGRKGDDREGTIRLGGDSAGPCAKVRLLDGGHQGRVGSLDARVHLLEAQIHKLRVRRYWRNGRCRHTSAMILYELHMSRKRAGTSRWSSEYHDVALVKVVDGDSERVTDAIGPVRLRSPVSTAALAVLHVVTTRPRHRRLRLYVSAASSTARRGSEASWTVFAQRYPQCQPTSSPCAHRVCLLPPFSMVLRSEASVASLICAPRRLELEKCLVGVESRVTSNRMRKETPCGDETGQGPQVAANNDVARLRSASWLTKAGIIWCSVHLVCLFAREATQATEVVSRETASSSAVIVWAACGVS